MKIQPTRLAHFSEQWFQSHREELAAMLAAGETLNVYDSYSRLHKPYLAFDNVEDALYPKHEADVTRAMQLCAIDPQIGGKHMKKLLEAVALELVDTFKDGFRASFEDEVNRSNAA